MTELQFTFRSLMALQLVLAMLAASASVNGNHAVVTVANLSAEETRTVQLIPASARIGRSAKIRLLSHTDIHAHNTFEQPENVKPVDFTVDNFDGTIELPAGSLAAVEFDLLDTEF